MPPKKKSDYSKTKMYYIDVDGERYYGHTINDFERRSDGHRGKFERHPNRKIYKAMRECGMTADDIELIFVEDYPCANKEEAEARERWWIENDGKLNTNIPRRTYKEWYEENKEIKLKKHKEWRENNKEYIKTKSHEYGQKNKEKIAEKKKEYREKNKEVIAEKAKLYSSTKVECPHCQKPLSRGSLSKHIKAIHKEITVDRV